MTKKLYKVKGMHCTSCPLVIESDLEDAGITAKCNYARATLEVEYDDEKTTAETVVKTVQASGYTIEMLSEKIMSNNVK